MAKFSQQYLKADLKLTGVDEMIVKILAISKAAENRTARRAIRAASRIVVVGARRRVKVDTGLLKRSLGVRIKTYRGSGVTVGVIGPRRGFRVLMKGERSDLRTRQFKKAVYRNPVHYAHLVERGFSIKRGGKVIKRIKAEPFMRPALEENRNAIQAAMISAIKKDLGI